MVGKGLAQLFRLPVYFVKGLAAQHKILPHNAAGILAGFVRIVDEGFVFLPSFQPFAYRAVEVEVGFYDGKHLPYLPGKQQAQARHTIQYQPEGEQPQQAAAFLILYQQYQVVAEVVIQLLRAAIAYYAAPNMVYQRLSHVAYFMPGIR